MSAESQALVIGCRVVTPGGPGVLRAIVPPRSYPAGGRQLWTQALVSVELDTGERRGYHPRDVKAANDPGEGDSIGGYR